MARHLPLTAALSVASAPPAPCSRYEKARKSRADLMWHSTSPLETTNRYASVSLQARRAAVEKAGTPGESGTERPAWRTDPTILDWIESL